MNKTLETSESSKQPLELVFMSEAKFSAINHQTVPQKKYLLQRLLESPPVRRPSLTAPHNDRLSGHLISRGGLCVRDTGKSRASQRARLMEISWNKYQTEIVIKTFHGEKVNLNRRYKKVTWWLWGVFAHIKILCSQCCFVYNFSLRV